MLSDNCLERQSLLVIDLLRVVKLKRLASVGSEPYRGSNRIEPDGFWFG